MAEGIGRVLEELKHAAWLPPRTTILAARGPESRVGLSWMGIAPVTGIGISQAVW
jgi:hypothetical protein